MTRLNKKVLLITMGIFALVVFAGIFVLFINLQAFKPRIEAAASAALNMEVRIKGLPHDRTAEYLYDCARLPQGHYFLQSKIF